MSKDSEDMNSRTLPKWAYYAVSNLAVVMASLSMPLWYPGPGRLPIWELPSVLIVSLIAVNLTLWYSLRLRERVALATDQTVANRKVKMKPIQFVLIGCGVLLLTLTMVAPSGQTERIGEVIAAFFAIGYGIVLGIRVHRIGPK